MNATTAQANGYLADKNKRMADKAKALGAAETERDCRRRQQRMIEPLHAAALVENQIRDL